MSLKVKIGSYVIDGARSSNASTTTGVRLGLPESPTVKWKDGPDSATVVFLVYLDGITGAANVKTAVDAVRSACVNTGNADLVIENDGTTQRSFLVSTNEYSRVSGIIEGEEAENGAFLRIEMTCSRIGASSGTAGDATGQIDALTWSYAQSSSGLGLASVEGVFKTRANATTFVQFWRNTGNWPSWLPASYWVMLPTPVYQYDQQLNQVSPVPATAFTPCRVAVFFQQIPAALASVMKSTGCNTLAYRVRNTPVPPLSDNAGEVPGSIVSIEGVAEFQTENNAGFDSGDTANVTGATLRAKTLTLLTTMKTDAESRQATTLDAMDAATIEIIGEGGQVYFSQPFISAGTNITQWEEDIEISFGFKGALYELDDGAEGVSGHKGGDEIVCTHTLAVESFNPVAYRKPVFIDSNWIAPTRAPRVPDVKTASNGKRSYSQRWRMQYRRLSEGQNATGSVASAAGVTIE